MNNWKVSFKELLNPALNRLTGTDDEQINNTWINTENEVLLTNDQTMR